MLRVLTALLALAGGAGAQGTSDLVSKTAFRVCADPANRPLSAEDGSGFENRIAELLADELDLPLEYTWFPMATGFIRRTLAANDCDVVIGYAQGDELVLNTNHYYTSTYVLIVKSDGPLAGVTTLSDPALIDKRLGVVAGSAPATHLVHYGL
ncbi:MAG: transporter substrate-binding domain-containing protein, partial [Albidovulum sp.]